MQYFLEVVPGSSEERERSRHLLLKPGDEVPELRIHFKELRKYEAQDNI